MSRLEEECILYVGRNRSGIDAGEIDFGIFTEKFERQGPDSLRDIIKNLDFLKNKCEERVKEITQCKHKECKVVHKPCRFNVYQCTQCNFEINLKPFDNSMVLNPNDVREF